MQEMSHTSDNSIFTHRTINFLDYSLRAISRLLKRPRRGGCMHGSDVIIRTSSSDVLDECGRRRERCYDDGGSV